MKKVVDKSTVCHMFANQTQDEARTPSGNLYFSGDTMYSYGSHFPIAKHVKNNKGENVLLFTTRTYSNSTAKHISYTRDATSHLYKIFCHNPQATHNDNLLQFEREIEAISEQLKTSRKPEIYLNKIKKIIEKIEKYAEFFQLNIQKDSPILYKAMQIQSKELALKYTAEKHDLFLVEQKKKQIEYDKKLKKYLKDWRTFKKQLLYKRKDFDYIRFNTLKNRFETSQDVQIPFEIAKEFYFCLKNTIDKAEATDCKVLDYQVLENNKKFVEIGCHKIQWSEIEKYSKLF